jgi:long-chain acyl-CoA synthetase
VAKVTKTTGGKPTSSARAEASADAANPEAPKPSAAKSPVKAPATPVRRKTVGPKAAASNKPGEEVSGKKSAVGRSQAKSLPKAKTASGESLAAAKPASKTNSASRATSPRKPSQKAGAATTKTPQPKPAGAQRSASKSLPKAITDLAAGQPQKPWLKSYPRNMPAEIGPLAFASIGELLTDACSRFSTRPAFTCMGKTLTYAQIERASVAFATFLQSQGLKKGARVALMMPNVLQYPIAMMAALRAGYVVVNINPLYTPRELEYQLKDSGAEAIVILENFAGTLQAVISKTAVKHVVVASMGDLLGGFKGSIVNLVVRRVKKLVPAWSLPAHIKFNAALKAGADLAMKPVDVKPDDVAFLQYTGGTTGISKGAILLHRNVLANVEQLALWVEDAYTVKPKPAHTTYICALPLYHIFALTVNALNGMQQGVLNVLIPNPRDIPGFVKELA